MRRSLKAIAILSLLLFQNYIFAQENKNSSVPEAVPILGTQLLHINSSIVNQEYDLYINLPRNYSDTSKIFPVLFLVDAQWDFPLVQSLYGEQYYDGFVPSIVVVGITWGGKNPNYDILRQRDLTPSLVQATQPSGNASKFLESIKKEIIPFVESKYRVTKDRALMGSSLGGLFTLYALFNETNLFSRYVLTSPSLSWGNGILYKIEKSFSEKNTSLPAKLFMGIGGYEDVLTLQKFTDLLRERKYKGLDIEFRPIEGNGHSGSKAEGYTRGLQFVYQRPTVKLDKSILEQYTGAYELFVVSSIKIAMENDQLVAITPDNNKITMHAETEKDFFLKGQYLFVHFVKDDSGKVTGFNLETFGGKQFIKKINN